MHFICSTLFNKFYIKQIPYIAIIIVQYWFLQYFNTTINSDTVHKDVSSQQLLISTICFIQSCCLLAVWKSGLNWNVTVSYSVQYCMRLTIKSTHCPALYWCANSMGAEYSMARWTLPVWQFVQVSLSHPEANNWYSHTLCVTLLPYFLSNFPSICLYCRLLTENGIMINFGGVAHVHVRYNTSASPRKWLYWWSGLLLSYQLKVLYVIIYWCA